MTKEDLLARFKEIHTNLSDIYIDCHGEMVLFFGGGTVPWGPQEFFGESRSLLNELHKLMEDGEWIKF